MGTLYVIIAALTWACANVCFQIFNSIYGANTLWINGIRIAVAGIFLLALAMSTQKGKNFNLFKSFKDIVLLVMYSISIIFMQTTFYYAISISNAGTATMLQYFCPVLILLFACVRKRKFPAGIELIAVISAVVGIVIIANHGDFGHLYLSGEILFWGLASAVAMAFYTIIPQELLKKHNTFSVTGFGMFIGSIEYFIVVRPMRFAPENVDMKMVLFLLVITVLSSIIPYLTFNKGIKMIGAVRASIICVLEPFASTVLAMLAGTKMTIWDGVGLIAIMAAVLLAALDKEK